MNKPKGEEDVKGKENPWKNIPPEYLLVIIGVVVTVLVFCK